MRYLKDGPPLLDRLKREQKLCGRKKAKCKTSLATNVVASRRLEEYVA